MARCPIVRPETVRVTLADGEWLELAKELTAGEYREMFVSQLKDAPMGSVPIMDMRQVGVSMVLAYVKEWSFIGSKGEPLPITRDWLLKFDQQTFDEVASAAGLHHEERDKAAAERKNGRTTASTSSAT